MFTWARIPFVRITLFFIAGIILGLNLPGHNLVATGLLVFAIVLLIGLAFFKKQLFISKNPVYGSVISLLFVLLGYLSLGLHNEINNKQNILHKSAIEALELEVRSVPEATAKSVRVLARVIQVKDSLGWQNAQGSLLIYLEPKEIIPDFGDRLIILGSPSRVLPPSNPHEFDYRKYLEHNNIFHTQWVSNENWRIIKTASGFDLYHYASKSRSYLERIFDEIIPNARSLGVVKALVLGDKADLDPETRAIFADAGAMHVLAVSGLHVGIIYLILIIIFKPISQRFKLGWTVSLIIIISLWVYAFITGLPPSVLRAVTMFTILELGLQMGKDNSVFNSLALSAFILLWVNPYLVTQVGFQLSYIAVSGILLLYKPILSLFQPRIWAFRFVWQITALSLSAQIATAPLAAYYFNQFPTYFLVSNLIVIPAVTVLVWVGVGTLILTMVSTVLGQLVGSLLSFLIEILEQSLGWLVKLPFSTISEISLDRFELILIYLFIGQIIIIIQTGTRRIFLYGLTCVTITIFSYQLVNSNLGADRQEMVFYSLKQNQWAIDFVANGQYSFVADTLMNADTERYSIQPNRIASGITPSGEDVFAHQIEDLGQVIVWQGKSILVAESCAHNLSDEVLFDFILHAGHPRYLDCYSDQNLLIKLVTEDGYKGHNLNKTAYLVSF